MKKIIFLIIILAVIGASAYFALFNKSGNDKNAIALQPQINEEGGVSAEVAPTGFELSNPQFKITFTAHQGDLNFDLTKNAVLIDDKNNQYKPISWTGGSGGHHLAGQLIFPAIAKNIKTIELVIKDVYGVKERKFFWDLK